MSVLALVVLVGSVVMVVASLTACVLFALTAREMRRAGADYEEARRLRAAR